MSGQHSIRRAEDATAADALEAEAALLTRLHFPGIVAVAGFERSGDRAELRYTDDGHRALADRPATGAGELCDLGAALARTLGEVHRAGVVHRSISGESVIVDLHGRPLLTGFATAHASTDHALVRQDVEALVDVLEGHLRGLPGDVDSTEQRRRRRFRRVCGRGRSLDANALAVHLAELGASFAGERPAETAQSVPSAATRIAVAAVAVASVVAVVLLRSGDPVVAPVAPVDPTGPVVEHDGDRYQVGRPGDIVVVGRWSTTSGSGCGAPTAALLRPATGAVYVFSGWADTELLVAEPVTVVDGASDLQGTPVDDCSRLVAVTPDGVVPVPLG